MIIFWWLPNGIWLSSIIHTPLIYTRSFIIYEIYNEIIYTHMYIQNLYINVYFMTLILFYMLHLCMYVMEVLYVGTFASYIHLWLDCIRLRSPCLRCKYFRQIKHLVDLMPVSYVYSPFFNCTDKEGYIAKPKLIRCKDFHLSKFFWGTYWFESPKIKQDCWKIFQICNKN